MLAPFITRFRMFMLTIFGSFEVSFGSSNCNAHTILETWEHSVTSQMHIALIQEH